VARRLFLGATREMVVLAWGEPKRKNVTVGMSGRHEQWVYGSGSYVYLDDGVVTAVSTTE
jgi:hypothetical protein